MTNALKHIQILWDFLVLENELKKSDVIIGFGSNDTNIPYKAVQLYLSGMAQHILFTGGLGKGTAGIWNKTEAEIFHDIAVQYGVNPVNIEGCDHCSHGSSNFWHREHKKEP